MKQSANAQTRGIAGRGAVGAALALLVGLAVALVVPLMVLGAGGTSESYDEQTYHLPIVRMFAAQWPKVDLVSYPSATAPGYHLALAGLLVAGLPEWTMRAASALASIGVVLAVFLMCLRTVPAWGALALTLPLVCSSYYLGAAIWLTTDNAALLLVVLALGGVMRPSITAGRGVRAGVYAAGAASIRQIHVWLAAPIALAGLLAWWDGRRARAQASSRAGGAGPVALEPARRGLAAAAGCAAGALAPIALVGWFVWSWGGLVPRSSGLLNHSSGANFATPALALSVAGLWAPFLLRTFDWRALRELVRSGRGVVAGGVAVGLAAGVIPPTEPVWPQRASGAVWIIAQQVPSVWGRSVAVPLMAALGGACLAVLALAARRGGRGRESVLLLCGSAAWIAAQSANSMAWQRYVEPMVLIVLAWLAALAHGQGGAREEVAPVPGWWKRWGGAVALGGVHLALSGATLYREAITSLLSR